MAINTIDELRKVLLVTLEDAIINKCEPKKVMAISRCAGEIIKTVQIEMAYAQATNKKLNLKICEGAVERMEYKSLKE